MSSSSYPFTRSNVPPWLIADDHTPPPPFSKTLTTKPYIFIPHVLSPSINSTSRPCSSSPSARPTILHHLIVLSIFPPLRILWTTSIRIRQTNKVVGTAQRAQVLGDHSRGPRGSGEIYGTRAEATIETIEWIRAPKELQEACCTSSIGLAGRRAGTKGHRRGIRQANHPL